MLFSTYFFILKGITFKESLPINMILLQEEQPICIMLIQIGHYLILSSFLKIISSLADFFLNHLHDQSKHVISDLATAQMQFLFI